MSLCPGRLLAMSNALRDERTDSEGSDAGRPPPIAALFGGLGATWTMPSGLFISLDGVDGAGKSTQCRLLADWLRAQGKNVLVCHDPGGTDLGHQLREILLNYRGTMALSTEALLFMASRAQLVADVIRPALA